MAGGMGAPAAISGGIPKGTKDRMLNRKVTVGLRGQIQKAIPRGGK